MKKCTKDSREKVRALASEIYSVRFPHAERNQMKKELHIKELTFTVNAYTCDEYGNEIPVSSRFYMKKTEPVISMQVLDGSTDPAKIRLESVKYTKLLKSIIHYYEIFCWDQDYCSNTSFEDIDSPNIDDISEPEEILNEETNIKEADTTWCVAVKYTNGTEQNIHGTDNYLPDKVGELYRDLNELFLDNEEEGSPPCW
ncbi:MAG: hypothetical protein PHT62_05315 [Desulfotomaculaceae bacterium]|nr:hypothetical protein [Desulfotomaculaceae bacterium]